MDASKLKQLKQFVEQCNLGGKVPSDDYKSKSHVEDSDEEELDDVEDEPQPYVEEEEPEIVESDIELDESDVVEADDEPPQKMGDSSVEVTEESHDASQEAKMQAMEAISDGKLEEAIEHLTKAIMLNPTSAIMYATRATVYIKMKKPNAAIRDASAALEINPDSAKGYKSRGIARAMLGQWGAAAKDLHLASNLDYDEEIAAVLKKISTSFAMDEVKKRKRLPVIPWMRNPVDVTLNHSCPLDSVPILHPKLVDTLQNMGFSSLFPVQIGVWHETIGPGSFERDLYITSPTGSGKTLAYALPIVQALSNRSIKCLRTLVVVPTRALAVQVKDVFAELGNAVGLSVGLAVGQSSIADEISELIEKPIPESSTCDPGDSTRELRSKVDILVATPGRLMDHVNNTKGFTLEHLCYLVVDEADRLLREAYQSWLPNVLRLAYSSNQCPSSFSLLKTFRTFGVERGFKGRPHPRLTKVILSATLTQDPSKLAQLDLHNPLFLTTGERRYQLPEQLKSFKVMCTSELKPLYLLALLEKMQGEKCIVFTSSVEKTHKLCDFLKSLGDLKIKMKEYSRLQRESTRSKTIRAFREGKIQVLISSDAMARGMDVEEVKNVISYDVPASIKIYIHRAGRTARAGQTGCCFTLLQKGEVKRFKTLLQKADKETCPEYSVPSESVESLCSIYPSASEKLKETSESGKYRKRKDNRVTQREGV